MIATASQNCVQVLLTIIYNVIYVEFSAPQTSKTHCTTKERCTVYAHADLRGQHLPSHGDTA